MDKEKAFELVVRLNEIRVLQQKLDMEHNQIIKELWDMIPSLKGDPNLILKKGDNEEINEAGATRMVKKSY